MPQFHYDPNGLSQDTTRGPSKSIWCDCPTLDLAESFGGGDQIPGMLVQDDFILCPFPALNATAAFGAWSCFADTGSLFVDANEEGGVVNLLPSATVSKAITLASSAAAFKLVSAATGNPFGQKMWFECRIALAAVSTATQGVFIGLADNTSSQIASANNTILATTGSTFTGTKGLIGFNMMASGTDWKFSYQAAGGSTINPTNLTTLGATVVGTAPSAYAAVTNGNGTGFIKLGFVFDPTVSNPPTGVVSASGDGTVTQTAGAVLRPILRVYVNGQAAPAFIDSTMIQTSRFPSKRMAPCISVMDASGGGGTALGIYIDWIRVAQIGSF